MSLTRQEMTAYFFERQPNGPNPGGVTVSKSETLPEGDFALTEFTWPDCVLWFIDDHKFTANEREESRCAALSNSYLRELAKT